MKSKEEIEEKVAELQKLYFRKNSRGKYHLYTQGVTGQQIALLYWVMNKEYKTPGGDYDEST